MRFVKRWILAPLSVVAYWLLLRVFIPEMTITSPESLMFLCALGFGLWYLWSEDRQKERGENEDDSSAP
jgi:hypothetical protein